MAVGPLAVFALSALGPLVTTDLGLGPSQFGALATFAFAAAASSAWLLGRWVDSCSARTIIFCVFAGTGLSLLVTALATSFGWLVAGVLLTGIAMSITNPVTNRLVAVRVDAGRRGTVMGVKQSGVQLGQLLAGLVLPTAALLVGWRGAVAMTLVVIPVGVVLAHLYVPLDPRSTAPRGRTDIQQASPLPYEVWQLLAYSFFAGAALQATNAYLPLFAYQRVSFTTTAAGLTGAVVGGVGLVARLAWGRATERSGNPRRILVVMALGGAVSMCLLAAASQTQSRSLVWVAAAVSGATAVASNVVVMVAAVRLVQQGSIGTASGLLAVGLYAGFAVGPVSFGLLVEATGYTSAWLTGALAYGLAVLLVAPRVVGRGGLP